MGNDKKIVIAETNMTGAEHLSFNACIISDLLQQKKTIKLYCSDSQYSCLPESIRRKVEFKKIPVIHGKSRSFVLKFLVDIFNILRIFFGNNEKIVLLSVFPPTLFVTSILAAIFRKKVKIFLHGELNGLRDNVNRKITSYSFWVYWYFKLSLYNYLENYIVGEHIRESIDNVIFIDSKKLKYINHPLTPKCFVSKKDIIYASIGYANGASYDALFSIMSEINKSCCHIGEELYEKYKSSCIIFHAKPGAGLEYEQYLKLVSRVQYGVFLYNHDYSFTTSGAMLDAMSNDVVIVSKNNCFASYLENIKYPTIILKNTEELISLLEHLPEYYEMIEQYDTHLAKENFSKNSSSWIV